MQPRVLIICERAAERDTMRVLVGTMGCQWVLASGIEEALGLVGRERTSAALLELSGAISNPAKLHQSVRELLVRFPGRVIVLTDGTPSPMIGDLISKYSIPFVNRDRVAVDLWPRLESMVYPELETRGVAKVARLVLDTFLQPLPAGIRYMQPNSRQLVFEAPALTADIALERPPNSPRSTLMGQVMRTKDPQIPMNGVTVVLKNRKGPLDVKMTNEAGEFSFEFQNENSISLEIEVSPKDWVLLISPPLDFAAGDGGQSIRESGAVDSLIGANGLLKKKGRSA